MCAPRIPRAGLKLRRCGGRTSLSPCARRSSAARTSAPPRAPPSTATGTSQRWCRRRRGWGSCTRRAPMRTSRSWATSRRHATTRGLRPRGLRFTRGCRRARATLSGADGRGSRRSFRARMQPHSRASGPRMSFIWRCRREPRRGSGGSRAISTRRMWGFSACRRRSSNSTPQSAPQRTRLGATRNLHRRRCASRPCGAPRPRLGASMWRTCSRACASGATSRTRRARCTASRRGASSGRQPQRANVRRR
mmetsp:Transcript_27178/g.89111  ORF Transcript_27178/g.89111 Transcript_27178/m.89111 type:complete len:250 (-) Transcript_27178:186-935(-)